MNIDLKWLATIALAFALGASPAYSAQLSATAPAVGGGAHTVLVTLANIASKYTEDRIELNANVPAPINMVALGRGENDLGYLSLSLGAAMSRNAGPFKKLDNAKELWGNIRSLFSFPAGYFHFLTHADSGITSFADLKGKTVYAGPTNGSQESLMKLVAQASAGLTAGKDYTMARLDYAGGDQAFKDNKVSLLIKPAYFGSAVINEFGLTRQIRLLGISDATLEKPEMKKYFQQIGRAVGVIPPGTYDGQVNKEPVNTVKFLLGIGASKNADEKAIYEIMSAFLAHYDEVQKSLSIFASLDKPALLDQLNAPLHPGAVKAYRDAGIDVPDRLIPPEMR